MSWFNQLWKAIPVFTACFLFLIIAVFSHAYANENKTESGVLVQQIAQDLVEEARYFLRIEIRETTKDIRLLRGRISIERRRGNDTAELQNELANVLSRLKELREEFDSGNVSILSATAREERGIILHGDSKKQMYCSTRENIKSWLGKMIEGKSGKPVTVRILPGLDPSIRCP